MGPCYTVDEWLTIQAWACGCEDANHEVIYTHPSEEALDFEGVMMALEGAELLSHPWRPEHDTDAVWAPSPGRPHQPTLARPRPVGMGAVCGTRTSSTGVNRRARWVGGVLGLAWASSPSKVPQWCPAAGQFCRWEYV